MSQDNLQRYGKSFQLKTLASMIFDKMYLEQIADIVLPDFFDSDASKWIVERTQWYFNKYRSTPTFEVFAKLIQDGAIDDGVKRKMVEEELKAIHQLMNHSDSTFIQEQFLDFCKNQKMKGAILSAAQLLNDGEDLTKFDQIRAIVDDAMKAGQGNAVGHDYLKDFEARMTLSNRNAIATPWDVMNDLMDGGLGAGELGVVVAPSGVGKSWFLTAIGAAAVQQGKRVAHYTLELSDMYTGHRYDTIFSGIPMQDLTVRKDDVFKAISSLPGELIIQSYPTKMASCNTLRAHLNRIKNLRGKVDLVIVDYGDLLTSTTSGAQSKYEESGNTYAELRGLAGEYSIPLWSASQTNRSGLEDDVIGAEKIADSYGKVMISDFIMSISRKVADKVSNSGRTHVMKNRFGPDGLTFPTLIDTSAGKFEMYEPKSSAGIKLSAAASNPANVQTHLLNRFRDLNGTTGNVE